MLQLGRVSWAMLVVRPNALKIQHNAAAAADAAAAAAVPVVTD